MDSLGQDVRFAWRVLRKNPGFACIATLALALGIGTNATMFTVVNGVFFRNLPFANSERVLYVFGFNRAAGQRIGISDDDYRDLQQIRSFQGLGAFTRSDVDVADNGDVPTRARCATVTVNTFGLIGQRPIAGRDFLPEDGKAGAAPVAILSYRFSQARYGNSASVVGQTIRINGVPTMVVGVMGPDMEFPGQRDFWTPLTPTSVPQKRDARVLTLFGTLAAGTSRAVAEAELDTVARQLEHAYPNTNKDIGARLLTYNDWATDSNTQTISLVLMGAVGCVLLIACANVATLLLARAVGRAREMSIRAALGAGRWQLIRQLLVESTILSMAGGVLGAGIGALGLRAYLSTLAVGSSASRVTYSLDYRVVTFLIAITLLTGVLFGLAPALRLSRFDLTGALKDGARGSGTGPRAHRLSAALVVAEMALAFMLLIGAGLMIRSFLNLVNRPIGVQTDHILSMHIMLREKDYPTADSRLQFHRRLKERIEALPGVRLAAAASSLPGNGWTDVTYERGDGPPPDPQHRPSTGMMIVTPDYFSVFGVAAVRGRLFSSADGVSGEPVAIVNQSFATAQWPSGEAVGRRIRIVAPPPDAPRGTPAVVHPWMTVVGVIPDVAQNGTGTSAHDPLIYLPYQGFPNRFMVAIARTSVPPDSLARAFQKEVQAVDQNLPISNLRSLDTALSDRTWTWREYGGMFVIFASIALFLGALGLYAVVASSVNQRTQEFGVRMALGATRRLVLTLVLTQGMRHVLLGLVVGVAGAWWLTRLLSALLVDVRPADPITFGAVGLVLAMAGALGCGIPAIRATRVDPLVALRND